MYSITLCIYCRKTNEDINVTKQFTVKEACERILIGDIEHYVSSVPVDYKTSIFLIDTSALKARDDVRIHMSGEMKNNRVQRDYVSVKILNDEIADITVLKKRPAVMRNSSGVRMGTVVSMCQLFS